MSAKEAGRFSFNSCTLADLLRRVPISSPRILAGLKTFIWVLVLSFALWSLFFIDPTLLSNYSSGYTYHAVICRALSLSLFPCMIVTSKSEYCGRCWLQKSLQVSCVYNFFGLRLLCGIALYLPCLTLVAPLVEIYLMILFRDFAYHRSCLFTVISIRTYTVSDSRTEHYSSRPINNNALPSIGCPLTTYAKYHFSAT